MQKLENAFTKFVKVHERIANDGVRLNINTIREDLYQAITTFAEAINDAKALQPEPAPSVTNNITNVSPLNRREEVWLRAWTSVATVAGRDNVAMADGCLRSFDSMFTPEVKT